VHIASLLRKLKTFAMKYKIAIPIVAIMFLLFACGALKHVSFYEDFHETATIPQSNLATGTNTVVTPDIPTNVSAQLKQNNTSPDLVQSVKLQTMTLTITAPPGQNFSFLQDIQVFILTDSLPAVEIASKHNIVSSSDTLNMDIDGSELKPYLLTNSFKMKYIITNSKATTVNTTLDIYLKFRFEANLLGAL
jgi:hypothetical protein